MKIAIVGGGTLGHIVPGLILGSNLAKKHEIIYITTKKDKRFNIFNKHKYLKKVYYIDSSGLSKNILTNIKTFFKDLKAMFQIKKIVNSEQIDLLIGMGGYISGLTMFCTKKKIYKIIHEQNKVMGMANKISIREANKILLTFDIDLKRNNNKKTIVSNPCLFIKKPNIVKEPNHILITSGSNGAKEINDLAVKIINEKLIPNYHITLVTGKKYYEETIEKIKNKENVDIYPFIDNMHDFIYRASFIISRAGSSTIFESIALDTIPLLFPSSNVTNNHQYYNAQEIVNFGIGEIINQDNVIRTFNKVKNHYQEYLFNIRKYKKEYNFDKIIELIEEDIISKN